MWSAVNARCGCLRSQRSTNRTEPLNMAFWCRVCACHATTSRCVRVMRSRTVRTAEWTFTNVGWVTRGSGSGVLGDTTPQVTSTGVSYRADSGGCGTVVGALRGIEEVGTAVTGIRSSILVHIWPCTRLRQGGEGLNICIPPSHNRKLCKKM